jgi:hypothetical protein
VISVILGLILLGVCVVWIEDIGKHLSNYRKYRATRNTPFKVGQCWRNNQKNIHIHAIRVGAKSVYVSGEDTLVVYTTYVLRPDISRIFTHDQLRTYIKKHKLHLAQ